MHDIFKRMHMLDRVLAAPAPHSESISAILPHNMDPFHVAEIKSSTNGYPAYGENSHNLGKTSNSAPAVLNSRYVSNHHVLSMIGGQPSIPVVYVPSNNGGKPLT